MVDCLDCARPVYEQNMLLHLALGWVENICVLKPCETLLDLTLRCLVSFVHFKFNEWFWNDIFLSEKKCIPDFGQGMFYKNVL